MSQTTIAKGSFWTLSSHMLSKLVSFVYTIIIARLLITEEIGIFYLVLSVLGILYMFTDLGLVYSLSRYVSYFYGKKEFDKLKSLVKLSYFGGGLLTLLFTIIVFFLSDFISELVGHPEIAPILKMMSIWLVIREIDNVNRGVLKGRKLMKKSEGLLVMQNSLKLVLTIIALYFIGFNAEALSVGFLLSFLLVLPVGLYYVLEEMKTWEKSETTQNFGKQIALGKEIVTFGIVVTLITTLWTVLQYTDRIMIGYFMVDGLEEIAIYTMAIGLANLVLLFPGAIMSIFFPVVSELYGKKELKAMNETLSISMKWLIMLMVPLALIIGIFSETLLGLFYGIVYEEGSLVLLLFVIGLFVRSVFSLPSLILSAMRKLDVELKAVLVAAVTNVILNVLLIPMFGINGAAMASMISFIILSLMIAYYSRKIFNFSFPKEAYKPLVAGFIAFVLIFLLKDSLVVLIDYISEIIEAIMQGEIMSEIAEKLIKFVVFGGLFLLAAFVYFVALLLLKSFGKEELDILVAAMKRARIPEGYIGWTRNFLEAKWFKLPRT